MTRYLSWPVLVNTCSTLCCVIPPGNVWIKTPGCSHSTRSVSTHSHCTHDSFTYIRSKKSLRMGLIHVSALLTWIPCKKNTRNKWPGTYSTWNFPHRENPPRSSCRFPLLWMGCFPCGIHADFGAESACFPYQYPPWKRGLRLCWTPPLTVGLVTSRCPFFSYIFRRNNRGTAQHNSNGTVIYGELTGHL